VACRSSGINDIDEIVYISILELAPTKYDEDTARNSVVFLEYS